MIFKRRWFRILAIVLGLLLFVGYFAFATFVFPPHEGRFRYDVAGLVPRDVDFFVAKADLRRDFGRFPHLKLVEDVKDDASFQAFLESRAWTEFEAQQGLKDSVAELEEQLSRIPLGMDLLDLFGGRDLALAGRFRGGSFADSDWAAYARASWAGKLGVALLQRGWLPLEGQGIRVEREGGVLRLAGGQLRRPHYLTRVRDVVVVGTSHQLVAGAVDLAARRGEGSLLASADYNDNIATAQRNEDRDELEVIVDMRDLLRNLGHQGPWPDPNAEGFMTSFLGKVFQAPSSQKVMGVLGMREGLQIDLQGGFASETITDDQRAIYSKRGFSQEDVLEDIGKLAPLDTALFVYMHGPIDVLLKQVFASMEPDQRSLLEQSFQQTGEFANLNQLVDHVSGGLADRLALIVRENDFEEKADDPPNDGRVVFLVSLVVWYTDGGKVVEEMRELIGYNGDIFGLQGRNPGDPGYYTNVIDGVSVHEFWNRVGIPGTGVMATFNRKIPDKPGLGRTYVFNNQNAAPLLAKTYNQRAYQSLADRPDFQELLEKSVDSANLLVWWNPQEARKTLLDQAAQRAREEASSELAGAGDWSQERRQAEMRILQENWPGMSRQELDEPDEMRFEELVVDELQRLRRQRVGELAPQLQREMERQVEMSQAMTAGLMMLNLDPREFRVSLRASIPVE